MTIDMNKQYKTRDGRGVKIYTVDAGGDFPVHGAINELGGWIMYSWLRDGRSWGITEVSNEDLVEVKQRIKRDVWINIYPHEEKLGLAHITKESADSTAGEYRIACVKVEIDCEEGEGL